MKAGKLPIEHLEKVLNAFKTSDPRIIAGPMPGEDASLIDMAPNSTAVNDDIHPLRPPIGVLATPTIQGVVSVTLSIVRAEFNSKL